MATYVKQEASEKVSYQDDIPITATASTVVTAWFDIKTACNWLGTAQAGAIITTSLDAKFEQATDISGTGAKDVTGKAITQLTAGPAIALVNLNAGDLDLANGFQFIRWSMAAVGTPTGFAGSLIALDPRYEPLAQGAIVVEVVS